MYCGYFTTARKKPPRLEIGGGHRPNTHSLPLLEEEAQCEILMLRCGKECGNTITHAVCLHGLNLISRMFVSARKIHVRTV